MVCSGVESAGLDELKAEDGGAVLDPGVWVDCCGLVSFVWDCDCDRWGVFEVDVGLSQGLDEGQVGDGGSEGIWKWGS